MENTQNKRGPGQPPKLTPEALERAWEEYEIHCAGFVKHEVSAGKVVAVPKPLIYTVEDFCVFAGISRETFYNYDKNKEYVDTTSRIREAVFARKQRALVNAEGSTQGIIFDMKANYGINEKNIIEHQGGINLSNLTDDDLLKLVDLQSKAGGNE